MQYGVYSIFCSWWVGRKEQLQHRIELWSIVIAKVDRLRTRLLTHRCRRKVEVELTSSKQINSKEIESKLRRTAKVNEFLDVVAGS